MLALERDIGESIIIDNNIEVKIVDIRSGGHIVRLGITAPKSVPVHRKEIQEAIDREKLSAAGISS